MISNDIQKLEPGSRIELFELDLRPLGQDIWRFHAHTQAGAIIWQGNEYTAWPIEATGFALTGEGQQPTPTLSVGNVNGSISALCYRLDDLVGAKLIRHVTLVDYLDAANFPEGNPNASDDELPVTIWFIEQKTSEDKNTVVFALKTALDLNGQQLPGRQIIANTCSWLLIDRSVGGGYRGTFCGYTGAAMFDKEGNAVRDPTRDVCGGHLSDCKKRFGQWQPINFGGFPSADKTRGY